VETRGDREKEEECGKKPGSAAREVEPEKCSYMQRKNLLKP
jgi:hypothetical protein